MKNQDPFPAEATGAPDEETSPTEIVTVRPTEQVMSKQRLPYFFGVSEETSGARGLSMSLVLIPPAERPNPTITATSKPRSTCWKGASRLATGRGCARG